jgi:hypothetical protein
MPIVTPIQSSFNAGELGRNLNARVDMAKYQNGCSALENFIPTVQGSAKKRTGFRFVHTASNPCFLVPFRFSETNSFVLEFSNQAIRIFTRGGYLINADTTDYVIPTPYLQADLWNADGTIAMNFTQTGDVVFIAHPLYKLGQLIRRSNVNWEFRYAPFTMSPFKLSDTDTNIKLITRVLSGTATPPSDGGTTGGDGGSLGGGGGGAVDIPTDPSQDWNYPFGNLIP